MLSTNRRIDRHGLRMKPPPQHANFDTTSERHLVPVELHNQVELHTYAFPSADTVSTLRGE